MMRLSLMAAIIGAGDAEGRSPIGDAIGARWSIDAGSVRFFRASANFAFTGQRGVERLFIRCNHIDERSAAEYADEARLLQLLAAAGVPVAAPVPAADGELVQTVPTSHGDFVAVALPRLAGAQPELEEISPEQLHRWGATAGLLHGALKRIAPQRSQFSHRPSWSDLLARATAVCRPDETALRREIDAVATELSALPTGPAEYGLIHYDLETDNLIWTADGPAIIDFDDCAWLWYAADIAFALRSLFSGNQYDPDDERIARFMSGYRSETQLSGESLSWLPLFYRMHRLVMIARLRHACDAAGLTGAPAWVGRLQTYLSGRIESSLREIEAGTLIIR